MCLISLHRYLAKALIVFAIMLATLPTYAVISGVTYQGRILKPDGSPLEGSNVQFRMQIRTPGGENCLLYEEQQSLDMRNTKGLFSLTLNDGNGARLDSSGFSIDRIFANRGALNFAGGACAIGTAYTPNVGDGRKLIVEFKDETMGSWEPMPPTNINFVPFALESRQVQGFGSNSLVRVQESDGTMGNVSPLSNAAYTELLSLIAGTSTQYVRNGTTAGARVPTYTGNPSSPVAGSIWFDTSSNQLKFRDGSSVQTVGTSGGSVSSVTAGTGLATTPSGGITSTGSIAIAVGGVVSTMLADGSVVTAKIADGAVTDVKLADGAVVTAKLADNSVTSAKIVDATIATADLADGSVTSAKIFDGTIVGGDLASNITISTTGSVTASGFTTNGTVTANAVTAPTVSAGVNVTRQIQLFDPDAGSTNKITFTADSTLSSDYTLIWPLDDGTPNQFLTTNGSGKLGWATITPGTGDFKADGSVPMAGNLRLNDQWLSNDGGAEGIRIDNSGSVGIGAVSPWTKLEVAGDFSASGGIYNVGNLSRAYTSTGATMAPNANASDGNFITSGNAASADSSFSTISLFARNTAGNNQRAYIGVVSKAGASSYTPELVIGHQTGSSSYSERMRIDQNGKVGIGTTSPQEYLDVAGAIRVGTTTTCGAPNPGTIRYNSGNLEYCNGTAWQILGVAGAGITALTGDVTASGTGSVAATIANNAVTSAKILDGTIATADVADSAITSLKIADGTIATADVVDKAVTLAKIQDIATNKLIGRSTASSGPMEELSIGTGLLLSGGTLTATATGLPSCSSGELALYVGSAWTCVGATSANTASTIVRRDSSGNFVAGSTTLTSSLILKDGAAGGQVSIATPVGFTSYALTLPVDDGTSGQVLSTNGTGALSWATITGGMPSNAIPTYQVRAATTADITLSGTQTIDGVAVVAGDRVLVKNQTTDSQNGVYVVAAGAWTRATDMDSWSETIGYGARVNEGTAWTGMTFTSSTTVGGTLGTTSIAWNAAGSGNPIRYNTANGHRALLYNTTGSFNTASGAYSLHYNSTGIANTATGHYSLLYNTTGNYNTATGYEALNANTTGSENTATGKYALNSNTTGSYNTADGNEALWGNTTGSNNAAFGYFALRNNTAKRESTAIGYYSMRYPDSTSTSSIAYNTALGAYSLQGSTTAANNTGTKNTALGHSALMGMTSGSNNIGIGYNAGSAITTGSNNVVIGSNTGSTIATSSNNILIADGAGTERIRIDSSGKVGIGTATPTYGLDVQTGSIWVNNGIYNAAGQSGTIYLADGAITKAYGSGWTLNGGLTVDNMVVFDVTNAGRALQVIQRGTGPSGTFTGGNFGVGTTTPSTILDVDDTSTTTSAIIVPRAAAFTGTTVNGMVRYNTTSNLFEFRQNGSWVNYTTVSDGRLKTDIEPVKNGLDIVNQLNPVFYNWDKRNPRTTSFTDKHEVGFIAQEVEKVLPEVVNKGEDGYRTLEYGKMIAVVVDAVKALYHRILGIEAHQVEQDRKVASVDAELAVKDEKIKKLEQENAAQAIQLNALKIWVCAKDPGAAICK